MTNPPQHQKASKDHGALYGLSYCYIWKRWGVTWGSSRSRCFISLFEPARPCLVSLPLLPLPVFPPRTHHFTRLSQTKMLEAHPWRHSANRSSKCSEVGSYTNVYWESLWDVGVTDSRGFNRIYAIRNWYQTEYTQDKIALDYSVLDEEWRLN